MNPILEVTLVVFLMFAPVFVSVEAILFSSPKEWWSWVTNMFINGWIFLQEKWRYFFLNRLEKIGHISKKINKTSDMAEQKKCLARLKDLAEAYRKKQQKAVVPKKSTWAVKERAYEPIFRFIMLLVFIIIWGLLIYQVDYVKLNEKFSIKEESSQLVIALFGLFPALILWFYRDLNNHKERETAHRDVIFSEHKQLVEWATTEAKLETTASAEADPATQATTANAPMIQVAGIYQLAPFLKDHHANLYQRSTLETLRAIVNAGRPKWDAWVRDYEERIIPTGKPAHDAPSVPELTAAEKAVHAVLRENPTLFYHPHFNAKDFNLAGFDGSGLVLVGCDLSEAQLEGANFSNANLESVLFNSATLTKTNFKDAKLYGSSFIKSYLVASTFNKISLLSGANFFNADLRSAAFPFGFFTQVKNSNVISFDSAIVGEPLLASHKLLTNQLKWLLLNGAINVAEATFNLDIECNGNCFQDGMRTLEFLEAKGLTATTKASLEAERQAQATTESETL